MVQNYTHLTRFVLTTFPVVIKSSTGHYSEIDSTIEEVLGPRMLSDDLGSHDYVSNPDDREFYEGYRVRTFEDAMLLKLRVSSVEAEVKTLEKNKFHKDGTLPSGDEVFVFGSNLAGVHGAGAAKAALLFGAKMRKGRGFSGRTYAIPTKDENLQVIPLEQIARYIEEFIGETFVHQYRAFFITRVGCGLAGYRDEQIAPLFRGAINCSFAEEWKPFLD